jgi:hypothetical protein
MTPDDDNGTAYMIPLHLADALMTFQISMPTETDLATLPIIDIKPDGVWSPSTFNETDCGLCLDENLFMPTTLAQMASCTTFSEPLDIDEFQDAHDKLLPNKPIFHEIQTEPLPNNGHFFDPLDSIDDHGCIGRAFHLSLDEKGTIDFVDVDRFLTDLDHTELQGDHEVFDSIAYVSRAAIPNITLPTWVIT